jgi:uncharacterized protein (DUF2141 family)
MVKVVKFLGVLLLGLLLGLAVQPAQAQDLTTRLTLFFNDLYAGRITIPATAFASLPADVNGVIRYCSDCTIANPCAGGGTGALAKRLNSAWVCN